ncbi:TlpA family protein disulfide reductase [Fodinibius sp. AD559]|uniref:TlpA family protein disulfide reductase n=1 Tax=Fodinibius sp. AD559 TaxID=3424179 RepID=UPI004046E38F
MIKPKHVILFLSFFVLISFGLVSESMGQDVSGEELLKDASGDKLKAVINSYEGDKAVLVNVWATWCAPCIEEFPYIVDLQQKYEDDLHVVFISADFPAQRDKALEFLQEQNVNWTTYFKTGKDQPFIEALSDDWSGALPFTKILNKNGEVVASWEQGAEYKKFERFTKKAINN